MRLRELFIQNFGCIGSEGITIRIDNIVILIGSNNVGKTTILKAYKAFSSAGSPLQIDAFNNYNESNIITIEGTFSDLSKTDEEKLGNKWVYQHSEYGECIKCRWLWKKASEKASKESWSEEDQKWLDGGMGGWDSIISSCLPKPLEIGPYDGPSVLESKIVEILTSAIKDHIKEDNTKLNGLIKEFDKLALAVRCCDCYC